MKPLEDGLETIIELGALPDGQTAVGQYLNGNPDERDEVVQMIELSRQIRGHFGLSDAERDTLEPSAGFYARVMASIEAQNAVPSFWNFFLEPFGRRLVYASLALAGLMFAATVFDSSFEPVRGGDVAVSVGEPSEDRVVLHGAVLASDGGVPLEESNDLNLDRGSALRQLTTYEQ